MAEALTAAGTSRVRADFLSGEATLEADGVHDDVLRTAVEQAGYRVLGLEDVEEREGGPVHRRGPRGRKRYDLLILGSGSAAFAAAIKAKDLGATVALCESNAIGGTCVNIGCVPSKAMLSAADVFHKAGNNPFPGVRTSAGRLNLRALVEWKDSLVDEMRAQKYENLAAEYGFTCFCGHGEFTGPGSYVCDGKQVEADKFIVATGASPAAPPIPGLDEAGYLTSTTALERRKLPATLAVIGANAIGPEMGQLFLRLGSKVTVLEALARVAPFEEPEISTAIGEALTDEGADVRPGVRITRVERNERGRAVVYESGRRKHRLECEQILVATGRRPNTRGIGLEKVGVELTDRGAVKTDEYLATANQRIWAAGDVTASPQFVYVAAAQGSIAAENALSGSRRRIDWEALPRVTFTSPQIASAGMTEEQANKAGLKVESRALHLDAVPRAIVNRSTQGLIKVVAEQGTTRVLGVHILADGAGDVILAATYAIKKGMTVPELAETWCPYLTMAEGLKLAAQTFTRDVKKLSCCAA